MLNREDLKYAAIAAACTFVAYLAFAYYVNHHILGEEPEPEALSESVQQSD